MRYTVSQTLGKCHICSREAWKTTPLRPESPYKQAEQFHILRCTECGVYATYPRPSDDELWQYYKSDSYYATNEASSGGQVGEWQSTIPRDRWVDRLRTSVRRLVVHRYYGANRVQREPYSFLAALIGRRRFGWTPNGLVPGRLLDVGSGDGVFLRDLEGLGWNAIGLEVSDQAATNAANLGIAVRVGQLTDQLFDPQVFDVVRLWSVLEHVSDPLSSIREVFRVLQPGGWTIIQVPNAGGFAARVFRSRWSGWHVPIHLWHFTRTSLYRLLKSAGFESISVHYASVGTLALTLGVNGNTTGRLAVAVADLGLDIAGAGDTLLIFARRPGQQSHATKPNVE